MFLRRVEEAEHVAELGESDETPVILFADLIVVCAIAVLVFLAIALLAYRLA
jgi:hypothetical protein